MNIVLTLAAILVVAQAALGQPDDKAPDFVRDVKPILDRNCIKCHGPALQEAGLRLDIRDAALSSINSVGAHAIVPHNANSSQLIRRVKAESDDLRMPPKYSGLPRLSPADVAVLTAWINAGPAWSVTSPLNKQSTEVNWSLRPLRRPRVPTSAVGSNPIDAFISEKLVRSRLAFSPGADKKTLLRRAYYDLTGLPPTPDEVAAFIADRRPGAYRRVVDGLLESPRYGERWARHWLDTIHFADSHGFEHDIGRDNAWPFRDYVIDSLNQDKAWSRFIREQLAADYFYPDEPQLTPALGYLGAGTFDLSAYTTAPRNFELIDRDDLVTQTMTAFASTTANCARCHAHKFDPIPQADYYALQAVFAGITKGDRVYESSPQVGEERKRWNAALSAADRHDAAVLLAPENQQRVDAWLAREHTVKHWQPVAVESAASAEGSTLTLESDGSVSSSGRRPETDTYTNTVTTALRTVTAVRLDVLASDKLPKRGPGRQDNGNLHLSEIEVQCRGPVGATHTVKLIRATADFNQEGWGVQRAIDGDMSTAWGIYPAVGQSHFAIFTFAEPQIVRPGEKLVVTLRQNHGGGHLIGLYRLAVTDAAPETLSVLPLPVSEVLQVPANQRNAEQQLVIAAHVLREYATLQLAKLPQPGHVYAAGASVDVPTIGVVTIIQPKPVHLLERGDIDKPREVVGPGALTAVSNLAARFEIKDEKNEAARRAALADWLANKNNPLTWRSIVNRVWHYHFGKGICDTPGDFGRMGGTPSHPELLDWLAVWFRDDAKGSLKELHRLIVTSETYCQSSQNPITRADRKRAEIDSDNRLLWRQNRQRLDADSYRDFSRAACGMLDLTMGGPGIKNFTMGPGPQLTPALDYTKYDWSSPGAGRRSIYRNVWRGISDPFMEALDFPDLGLLAPVRTFSVSALQALALYNDPFVLHCSELLAKLTMAQQSKLELQVTAAARRIWLRTPSAAENAALLAYTRQHGLSALCRVLLNSNEFLFVD